jgi:hypothetical protein
LNRIGYIGSSLSERAPTLSPRDEADVKAPSRDGGSTWRPAATEDFAAGTTDDISLGTADDVAGGGVEPVAGDEQ